MEFNSSLQFPPSILSVDIDLLSILNMSYQWVNNDTTPLQISSISTLVLILSSSFPILLDDFNNLLDCEKMHWTLHKIFLLCPSNNAPTCYDPCYVQYLV